MKMQIGDVSKEYEMAAEMAYQRKHNASASHSHDVVYAYVTNGTQAFSKQPRTQIEQFIDACPQPTD
jgi:hypothetical protein